MAMCGPELQPEQRQLTRLGWLDPMSFHEWAHWAISVEDLEELGRGRISKSTGSVVVGEEGIWDR